MPQPSTDESFLLIIGGIFLAIGILGGGFEVGPFKIPSAGRGSRITGGVLRAQTQEVKDWEKFEFLCLDDGKVALRTYHRTYVTAMNDEDDRDWKLAQTQELKDREKFTLFNAMTGTQLACLDALKLFGQGESNIALRTYHGRYVTAMDSGYDWKLRAQTQELKDWEKFTVILQ